jgi:hypothetical protein
MLLRALPLCFALCPRTHLNAPRLFVTPLKDYEEVGAESAEGAGEEEGEAY